MEFEECDTMDNLRAVETIAGEILVDLLSPTGRVMAFGDLRVVNAKAGQTDRDTRVRKEGMKRGRTDGVRESSSTQLWLLCVTETILPLDFETKQEKKVTVRMPSE